MKNRFIFLLVILIVSCTNSTKKETFYILYHGNRTINIPDLVLKNNEKSFVDSIMLVGKPIECLINNKEFDIIKNRLEKKYLYNRTNNYSKGIMIIHYIDQNVSEEYLFKRGVEIDNLIKIMENDIQNKENKRKIIDWIKGVQKVYGN